MNRKRELPAEEAPEIAAEKPCKVQRGLKRQDCQGQHTVSVEDSGMGRRQGSTGYSRRGSGYHRGSSRGHSTRGRRDDIHRLLGFRQHDVRSEGSRRLLSDHMTRG